MCSYFNKKVSKQTERLRQSSLHAIERETAEKRVKWLSNNSCCLEGCDRVTPRRAFEVLFFDYMGLFEDDVPVTAESETEIAWLSVNPCPTLEACRAVGMDTRKVCRGAYEKSTQAFLSHMDPQLRFLRDYEEIRPYAPHCRERIVRVDFERMMRFAIEQSRESRRGGDKGYGAIIALGDKIIAQGHDTAATEGDPSLHAEVNVIRRAVRELGDSDLSGAVLFSSCEPCPMCSSLAVWANLTTIVYGASIAETAACGKARIEIGAREIASKSPVMLEVIGGVLGEECRALYA